MDVLRNVDQLIYINLSSNLLFEDQESINYKLSEMPKKKKGEKKKKYKMTNFDSQKDQTEVFNQVLSMKTKITVERLTRFIKNCKNLIHADFSHT